MPTLGMTERFICRRHRSFESALNPFMVTKKKLIEAFGISEDQAKEMVRMIRRSVDAGTMHGAFGPPRGSEDMPSSDDVLARANEIMGGFGVESIECANCQVDRFYYGIVLLYVNKGDTYSTTLLYDTDEENFSIGSWGDWFEAHEAKKHQEDEEGTGEEQTETPWDYTKSVKHWRPK